jgi:hypothetical protein
MLEDLASAVPVLQSRRRDNFCISLLSIHDFKEKDSVMKQCLIFAEWLGRTCFIFSLNS